MAGQYPPPPGAGQYGGQYQGQYPPVPQGGYPGQYPGPYAQPGQYAGYPQGTRAQQPGQYGYNPGYPQGQPLKPNGLAIASLVIAILGGWIFFLGPIVAIIFGGVALSQIKRANGTQTGRGLAIAGMVVGGLAVAITLIAVIAASVASNNLNPGALLSLV